MCVVILAKTPSKARALSASIGAYIVVSLPPFNDQIADRTASKTYLARVRGSFPQNLSAEWLSKLHLPTPRARVTIEGKWLRVQCPLVCKSHKAGVWTWALDGASDVKEAETLVQFHSNPPPSSRPHDGEIGHDDDGTTVVLVKVRPVITPVTGRTHQIRLHLQLLGLPIANDPCYGGTLHFGSSFVENEDVLDGSPSSKDAVETSLASTVPQLPLESEADFLTRTCQWCARRPENENHKHCARIWLHAWRYEVLSS
ncbi:hypothetical protein DYB37_007961 [Aphanomyces astaci]|uniref:Pseudouridine synthase RsuA/RluA-like domain-containing protein n=1 Tax=Aphanomyces astaci TaxID=112090 RepID=A0A3R7A9V1_APHAT|nr:hypothetical protein DYB37_007961 [Aphanomyces astaci]